MKTNIIIGLMTLVWLVLMADILFWGTDGGWMMEDVEKIAKLEVAKYANQMIVVAVSEDGANLCMYERKDDTAEVKKAMTRENSPKMEECETCTWKLVLETEAIIGKNGLGKTKEGDGKTPIGVFLFVEAFGILENPGTNIRYTKVDKSHYWVDDSDSNYYNQFISTKEVVPDWKSAEHIVEYGESYHYVLATSYNSENIPGVGSAVFLHCMSGEAEATAGCIAVSENSMQKIMKQIEPECVLIVDKIENILSY